MSGTRIATADLTPPTEDTIATTTRRQISQLPHHDAETEHGVHDVGEEAAEDTTGSETREDG